MTTYQAKIRLPDAMQTTVQEIEAVGAVVGITDQDLLVEFDCTDPYDLGVVVTDLEHTLQTLWMEGLPITRPVPQT